MENNSLINYLGEKAYLPDDFDWKLYLIYNPDIILCGLDTEEQAIHHYLNFGFYEYRIYYEKCKITHFVYCGGKCGSSTLNNSLFKNRFRSIGLHSNEEYKLRNNGNSILDIIHSSSNTNETIYFIDSYRNPIERKISSFFQNLDSEKYNFPINELIEEFNKDFTDIEYTLIINYHVEFKDKLTSTIKTVLKNRKIDDITDTFIKVNVGTNDNLNILCNIFDKYKEDLGILSYTKAHLNYNDYYHSSDELFRHFNISETFTNFDFDKKYGTYKHENMVFIKLRFCDISDWDKILSDIFGEKITIFPDNLSEHKEYYELYKEFKSQYKIPKFFIKELLKDKHFNAFNTIEEKRQYIKHWMGRSY